MQAETSLPFFFCTFRFGGSVAPEHHSKERVGIDGRRQNWLYVSFVFGFWPRPPPPPRGGALMPQAPSRSRSRTFSSLQLVHRGDHARSTQQCITASSKRASCDPAPKSHSEIAYCCETYRRLAVDLKSATCMNMLGLNNLAERLIHRTMLNPRSRH